MIVQLDCPRGSRPRGSRWSSKKTVEKRNNLFGAYNHEKSLRLSCYSAVFTYNAEKLGQLGALASGAGGAVLDMVKDPLSIGVSAGQCG
jgi:hypothetical protein